ncbi:MAG: carboxypeptidase-like regulatory domain-containing protein [Bacteroidales bacterium]|nr:carboxypeptidase-like regulatory domain-containing protein [Bacteroidales bacterium]
MKKIIISSLILIAFTFFSCTEKNTIDTYVTGSVKLFDEGATPTDNSGMTVSVEDTTLGIYGVTDENGNFKLKNLPKGTFNLIYEKEGYGTYKVFGFENTGDGLIKEIPKLGKISTTKISSIVMEKTEDTLYFYVLTEPAPKINSKKYIRIFLTEYKGTNSEPDYLDAKWHSDLIEISGYGSPILRLDKEDLLNLGFSSGTEVLYKAYVDSYYSNDYIDPYTGKRIFPNLNKVPSSTLSFIVP